MEAHPMIVGRDNATPDAPETAGRRIIPLAFVAAPRRAMSISPGS
jgi:hypothetical protein